MSSLSPRTPADALRDERGVALAGVVLISMLIGGLAALALNTSDQAQRASARDRNHEIALGVAEAGIYHTMVEINRHLETGNVTGSCLEPPFSDDWCEDSIETPQGNFDVRFRRTAGGFQIDSVGRSTGESLARARRVFAEVLPEPLFPGDRFALFSHTSIELKNNNEVLDGDVWANDSVTLSQGSTLNGSVTSATSWLKLENQASVMGDAVTGGFNTGGWAMQLGNAPQGGYSIEGSATASAQDCGGAQVGQPNPDYNVLGNGKVGEDLTTWGSKGSQVDVDGNYSPATCEDAPGTKSLPGFTWDPNNYETVNGQHPSQYAPWTVTEFMTWLNDGNKTSLSGTFHVVDPTASQANRIDLSGVSLAGSTTIVTDAPIFAHTFNDAGVDEETGAIFVLVTFYAPPNDSGCSVNQDSSDCAIHFKNNFDVAGDDDCKTFALLYAHNGAIALKNDNNNPNEPDKMCGSAVGRGILTKNNQKFEYAEEIDRLLGFGNGRYEIARWIELPVDAELPG